MPAIQYEQGSASPSLPGRSARWLARAVLWLALAAAMLLAGLEWRRLLGARAQRGSSSLDLVRSSGLMLEPATKHLAPGFNDAGGSLLADPLTDPASQLDPREIVLA